MKTPHQTARLPSGLACSRAARVFSRTPGLPARPAAPPRSRHRGFTLVELLVVIAIIGTLVGLLLPAVQAAREAARRCACANNVSQLGLALHNHEFHAEKFPAGVTDPDGPVRSIAEGRHIGWLVRLLPYLEESRLLNHFDDKQGVYAADNAPVRRTRLGVVICPSSPDTGARRIGEPTEAAISSYAGCHHDREAPIDADNRGVLFLNSAIRFKDIRDGSSNTLAIGEHRNDPDDLGWMSGTRATLRNTSPITMSPDRAAPQPTPPDPLAVGGFASAHAAGIVVVAMADGSVRMITSNILPDVLRQMGDRADGELPAEEDSP